MELCSDIKERPASLRRGQYDRRTNAVIDFVLEYRRGWAWKDMSVEEVESEIVYAGRTGQLASCWTEDGKRVMAVATFNICEGQKLLDVCNVVSRDRISFVHLLALLAHVFKGWNSTYNHKGRDYYYDYPTICKLLAKLSHGK